MTYRGAVVPIAWGAHIFSIGFWMAVQLLVVDEAAIIWQVMFAAVLASSACALVLMAYKRFRGEKVFGADDVIERWRAWVLLGTSPLWLIMSLRTLWANS